MDKREAKEAVKQLFTFGKDLERHYVPIPITSIAKLNLWAVDAKNLSRLSVYKLPKALLAAYTRLFYVCSALHEYNPDEVEAALCGVINCLGYCMVDCQMGNFMATHSAFVKDLGCLMCVDVLPCRVALQKLFKQLLYNPDTHPLLYRMGIAMLLLGDLID